jgi:hypothetical protein
MFVLLRGGIEVAQFPTQEGAVAAALHELPSHDKWAIAMSNLAIASLDKRGRARRRWSSRELAALVLGRSVESLGPWGDLPEEAFERVLRSGRDFRLIIGPDSGGWALRLQFQRLDEDGQSSGRDKVFLGWDDSRDALERRAKVFALRLPSAIQPAG